MADRIVVEWTLNIRTHESPNSPDVVLRATEMRPTELEMATDVTRFRWEVFLVASTRPHAFWVNVHSGERPPTNEDAVRALTRCLSNPGRGATVARWFTEAIHKLKTGDVHGIQAGDDGRGGAGSAEKTDDRGRV